MSRRFIINVNGNDYDVEVTEVTQNQVKADKSVEAKAAAPIASAPVAPKAPVKSETASSAAAGTVKITAPMPGTVIKVNVEQGQSVKKGQVLLILEAMKMENEIVAPNDGTIASVNVLKGSKVNAEDTMVSMG